MLISNLLKKYRRSGGNPRARLWHLVEVRGIEPLAPCLQSRCSPAELHPHGEIQCRFSPSWLSTNLAAARTTHRIPVLRTIPPLDALRFFLFFCRNHARGLGRHDIPSALVREESFTLLRRNQLVRHFRPGGV